jgi:hypothetical protein
LTRSLLAERSDVRPLLCEVASESRQPEVLDEDSDNAADAGGRWRSDPLDSKGVRCVADLLGARPAGFYEEGRLDPDVVQDVVIGEIEATFEVEVVPVEVSGEEMATPIAWRSPRRRSSATAHARERQR